MEAVEFIRTLQKMCTGRHCDDCPLSENYRCNVCYTDDPEESVRIVEEWAEEQERQNPEQESKKPEQEKRNGEPMSKYIDLSKMPQLETWESFREGEGCSFVAVADVIQALMQAEAHTGEVAPVVHAKWIPITGGSGAECSNCGEYYDSSGACDSMEGFRLFSRFYRYCPNCGCRMDGGDDE